MYCEYKLQNQNEVIFACSSEQYSEVSCLCSRLHACVFGMLTDMQLLLVQWHATDIAVAGPMSGKCVSIHT